MSEDSYNRSNLLGVVVAAAVVSNAWYRGIVFVAIVSNDIKALYI